MSNLFWLIRSKSRATAKAITLTFDGPAPRGRHDLRAISLADAIVSVLGATDVT